MLRFNWILLVVFSVATSPAALAQSEDGLVKASTEKKVDSTIKALSGISIIGNKEAPKSLYIVPWKSSEVGVESDLVSSLMDDQLKPLDKEVFLRELTFYQLSLSGD
ncbi:hypothetical protein ACL7TT_17760 [Microbulbifer sp. 2304DJ12-6]|uniref:hypothetical protein n=1 Tax=Microbulbifer sp. 2304DJ12-6 TaxID=3233340 RepID=UPI0039AEEB47